MSSFYRFFCFTFCFAAYASSSSLQSLDHDFRVYDPSLSPSGNTLITRTPKSIFFWNYRKSNPDNLIEQFGHPGRFLSLVDGVVGKNAEPLIAVLSESDDNIYFAFLSPEDGSLLYRSELVPCSYGGHVFVFDEGRKSAVLARCPDNEESSDSSEPLKRLFVFNNETAKLLGSIDGVDSCTYAHYAVAEVSGKRLFSCTNDLKERIYWDLDRFQKLSIKDDPLEGSFWRWSFSFSIGSHFVSSSDHGSSINIRSFADGASQFKRISLEKRRILRVSRVGENSLVYLLKDIDPPKDEYGVVPRNYELMRVEIPSGKRTVLWRGESQFSNWIIKYSPHKKFAAVYDRDRKSLHGSIRVFDLETFSERFSVIVDYRFSGPQYFGFLEEKRFYYLKTNLTDENENLPFAVRDLESVGGSELWRIPIPYSGGSASYKAVKLVRAYGHIGVLARPDGFLEKLDLRTGESLSEVKVDASTVHNSLLPLADRFGVVSYKDLASQRRDSEESKSVSIWTWE